MSDPTLSSLFLRWERAFEQGCDLPPEELCAGQPHLLGPLREGIDVMRRMKKLEGTVDFDVSTVLPPPLPETGSMATRIDPARTVSPPPAHETGSMPPRFDPARTVGHSATEPPAADGRAPSGYEILGELGRGGMGVVYKARQVGLNRVVALKMILSGGHAGDEERARFLIEAEAIARIKHPGIVQVFDFGTHDDLPYFSLELCEGGSLADRLKGGAMTPAEGALLVERVARAVHAAHQAGVIHRDLKPGNVLLAGDGLPRVTDFGLAKRLDDVSRTHTGVVMGTPSYMSPEQARGRKDVGPPTDVWALGGLLYACLAGRPPFQASSTMDTLMLVMSEEPLPLRRLNSTVPPDLETICHKCLQKDVSRRYGSAAELADDLGRFLNGEPIRARPVGAMERALKWARRRPTEAALIGLGLVTLVLLGLGGVMSGLYYAQQARALRLEGERQRQADTLRLRGGEAEGQARAALARGDHDEAAGRFSAAQGALEQALAALAGSPDEETREEVAQHLEAVRREAAALAARVAQRQRVRGWVEALGRARDDVLARHLSVEEAEKARNREAIATVAPPALAPFESAVPFESDEQRRQAARWGCEVLLVWAEVEADPKLAVGRLDRAAAWAEAGGVEVPQALYRQRARLKAAAGDAAGAKADQARADARPPATGLDHFLLAVDRYHQGKLDEAVRGCEEAEGREPGYFWPPYLRGLCHFRQGQWALADAWLTRCVAQRKDFLWPRLLRAAARVELGNLTGAEADLAAEVDGKAATYLRHLTRGQLAVARPQPRWKEARDELKRAIAVQPAGAHQAHVNLAYVYRKLNDVRLAVAEMDRAVAARPNDGQVVYTRAQVHREANDTDAAWADYEKAIALGGKAGERWLASAHVELGYLKHLAGEHDGAMKEFDAALKVVPGYAPAYRQMTETLLALGKRTEAGKAMDAYLARATPDAETYRARGLIHTLLNEYGQAAFAFSRSLQLKDDVQVRNYRGWAFLQAQSLPLALIDFEAVLKADADHADALCGRAVVRSLTGEAADAVADAEKSLEKGEPTVTLLRHLAAVYVRAAQATPGRRYEARGASLLIQAAKKVPVAERVQFWRDKVEKDKALQTLLRHPEVARLARSHGW